MREQDYKVGAQIESGGASGEVGIRIMVNLGRDLTKNEQRIVSDTADEIHAKIVRQIRLEDPEVKKNKEAVYQRLVSCFDGVGAIHVRKVDNPQIPDVCQELVVTTVVGPIKISSIGRKIHIDWSDSDIKEEAHTLLMPFAGQPNVLRAHSAHRVIAENYEVAKVFINSVIVIHEVFKTSGG